MKISQFIQELLAAQTKYGDIDIEIEYDGGFCHLRIDRVATVLVQWDIKENGDVSHVESSTPPRLILK